MIRRPLRAAVLLGLSACSGADPGVTEGATSTTTGTTSAGSSAGPETTSMTTGETSGSATTTNGGTTSTSTSEGETTSASTSMTTTGEASTSMDSTATTTGDVTSTGIDTDTDSTSTTGEPLCMTWEVVEGGAEADYVNHVARKMGGGFALAGRTRSKGAGLDDFWWVHLSEAGEVLEEFTYGSAAAEIANAAAIAPDQSALLAGIIGTQQNSLDGLMIGVSSDGAKLWEPGSAIG
ncbi:MAG: hypothetical protein R3B09_08800 [Nannocystaceae bacterium]